VIWNIYTFKSYSTFFSYVANKNVSVYHRSTPQAFLTDWTHWCSQVMLYCTVTNNHSIVYFFNLIVAVHVQNVIRYPYSLPSQFDVSILSAFPHLMPTWATDLCYWITGDMNNLSHCMSLCRTEIVVLYGNSNNLFIPKLAFKSAVLLSVLLTCKRIVFCSTATQ